MASSSPNRLFSARAAAILTNAEVAAGAMDLNDSWGSKVSVQLDFTLGSLTNVIIRFYASVDGTTYYPIAFGSALQSETITASGTRVYPMLPLVGWKFFRATVQGTGTVTSSSATLNYRYLRRGTQM